MGNRGKAVKRLLTSILLFLAPVSALAEACREDLVQLRGDWGQAQFTVEVADDPSERGQGLMHRDSLPPSAGMLFVYDKPDEVSFWMRNTLIPLDMIFVDAMGVVQHVHHEAVPLSEESIFGGDMIQYVLEVNGGLARAFGITQGTELRHPAIANAKAKWPCGS
ncbi:DUF192 domain-containing protein [Roseovarius sp. W115]|uniref:DUF192 domain-containing protein n=1 Tax=Roseovarius rhodophyticola TaxID=3080827 RepID=A0ABZ2TES2_9RHOB|nr:DUF192 domain-containing protein [Roseovarius sp. W115]MDV2928401.1 DUF192 domain-containing protein [Roseovarius sp. W115]